MNPQEEVTAVEGPNPLRRLTRQVGELSQQVGQLEREVARHGECVQKYQSWLADLTFDNTILQLMVNDLSRGDCQKLESGEPNYAHYRQVAFDLFHQIEAEKSQIVTEDSHEPVPFGG